MTTFDAGAAPVDQRLLDEVTLRPMPALAHDPLSRLELGEGRERNLLYAVFPADEQADPIVAVGVPAHRRDGEVRLLRPGSAGLATSILPLSA